MLYSSPLTPGEMRQAINLTNNTASMESWMKEVKYSHNLPVLKWISHIFCYDDFSQRS